MKKVFLLLTIGIISAMSTIHAQDYDRIGASFDCMFLHANSSFTPTGNPDNCSMFGFGVNYVHGFAIDESWFAELGLSFSNTYGSSSDILIKDVILSEKFTNAHFQVPINFVRRISLNNDDMSLSLFAGVNVKYNLTFKCKTSAIDAQGRYMSDTNNLLSTGDMNPSTVWHRWQLGWQIGVGLNIKKLYVGLSGGTDFIPAYDHSGTKARVGSAGLKLNIGYTFSFKDLIKSPSTPKKVIYLPKESITR